MEDRRYHHGNLRGALVDAAVDLARTGGPEAVQLRAVTRVAGVSHNAAYRHFADLEALHGVVAARCMAALARLMEARVGAVGGSSGEAAWARLRAAGRTYVEFAVTETGWFRTAFSLTGAADLPPGEGVGASGLGPYGLLSARLDELVAVGALPAARRPGLETGAWSAVHGFATLVTAGPLRALPAADREAALEVVLAVVARGL